MKKFVNGKYIKMTKAEIEELKASTAEPPEPQETVEELIAKIEESRREQDAMMERLRSMLRDDKEASE